MVERYAKSDVRRPPMQHLIDFVERTLLLLALDTATATASVAVYDRQRRRLLSEITWQARRRHTQDLMPAVQQALAYAGAGVEQITALAVTTGPGSFTGVRIGISAVKGLGLGMAQTPQTVGVPTLSVTAAPWLDAAAGARRPLRSAPSCRPVAVATTGPSSTPAICCGGLAARSTAPALPENSARWPLRTAARLAGGRTDAALEQEVAVLDHVCLLDGVSALRRAGHLARLADRHLAAGNEDDLAGLQPLYLQNP